MKIKRIVLSCAVALLITGLVSCGSQEKKTAGMSDTGTKTTPEARKLKIRESTEESLETAINQPVTEEKELEEEPEKNAWKTIEETACLSAVGYGMTMNDIKNDLLEKARKNAAGRLYEDLYLSFEGVNPDEASRYVEPAMETGLVYLKGFPEYKNGTEFGEVCSTVKAYIAEEDLDLLTPVMISGKDCVTKTDLSTKANAKKNAREKAIIFSLLKYEKKLYGKNKADLINLVHQLKVKGVPDDKSPDSYCVSFKGVVYPFEILSFLENSEVRGKERPLRSRKYY
jgi:hypothetical protein